MSVITVVRSSTIPHFLMEAQNMSGSPRVQAFFTFVLVFFCYFSVFFFVLCLILKTEYLNPGNSLGYGL